MKPITFALLCGLFGLVLAALAGWLVYSGFIATTAAGKGHQFGWAVFLGLVALSCFIIESQLYIEETIKKNR